MNASRNQLHTEPFVTEREWAEDGVPILTASVSVPQPVLLSGRTARRISRFYRLQSRAYLRYCERWLFPQARAEYYAALTVSAPLPHFRAELNYRVTYNEGGFWSLYTQSREVTLPGQTLLTRHGDTWDLSAGYPVDPGDFFPPRAPWKRRLLQQAAQEIERQERAGVSAYRDGWRRALRRRFNPRNFYLTDDGLAFFFPMYSIAPAAEGIPTFLIPYDDGGGLSPRFPGGSNSKKGP